MKTNMGSVDRIVRISLAVIALILIVSKVISGPAAIVAGIAAIILLGTSTIAFCPLYTPFGLSTKRKTE